MAEFSNWVRKSISPLKKIRLDWGLVSTELFSASALTKVIQNEFEMSIRDVGDLTPTECRKYWRDLVDRVPTQTVTLQQIAGIVHRSRRSLEKHKQNMPRPLIAGTGRTPATWEWSSIRPWLEETFKCTLPNRCPH